MIKGLKTDITESGEIIIYDFGEWHIRSEFTKKSWAVYTLELSTNEYIFIGRTYNINDAIKMAKDYKL